MKGQLPNLLIIGAPRAGTTFIYDMLIEDERIFAPSLRKEINYFDVNFSKGLKWYSDLYDQPEIKNSEIAYRLDASPGYLAKHDCAQKITTLPNKNELKFIICIRDPVDRAYSQWKYRVQKRAENRTFSEFMSSEKEAIRLSSYGKSLQKYLKDFSEEQFFIIHFEDIINKPQNVQKKLYKFLELEGYPDTNFENINKNISFLPKYKKLYHFLFLVKQWMRQNNQNHLVNYLKKKINWIKVFKSNKKFQIIDANDKQKFSQIFTTDQLILSTIIKNLNTTYKDVMK